MQVRFACPRCDAVASAEITPETSEVACPSCHWTRACGDSGTRCCVACGCADLWRQKDFPQKLGIGLVAVAAVLSTIAWGYHRPGLAIGILMGFALVDLLLFLFMPDVLKCYRCGAQHRGFAHEADVPKFELATHERYRQESLRMESSPGRGKSSPVG